MSKTNDSIHLSTNPRFSPFDLLLGKKRTKLENGKPKVPKTCQFDNFFANYVSLKTILNKKHCSALGCLYFYVFPTRIWQKNGKFLELWICQFSKNFGLPFAWILPKPFRVNFNGNLDLPFHLASFEQDSKIQKSKTCQT